MPVYEYRCQKCGDFEITQRITDKPLGKCPTCKGKVKKLISNTSFQLKGTGWYVTDYARKGQNGDSKKGDTGKSETKSESKSETKTESKTESKNESKKSDSSSSSSGTSSSTSSSAS